MKILIISGDVSHQSHSAPGITAIHVQLYYIIKFLSAFGHRVVLQIIFHEQKFPPLQSFEEKALGELKEFRTEVLPPVFTSEIVRSTSISNALAASNVKAIFKLVTRQVDIHDFYPSHQLSNQIADRIRRSQRPLCSLYAPHDRMVNGAVSRYAREQQKGDSRNGEWSDAEECFLKSILTWRFG